MGVDVGIIKNGIHGSHVTTQISSLYVPAYQVDTIDSISAGDAYVAGMLASLCKRFSIIKSANYASASGALACQGFG
jgi:sugar/nucleoside kinase (ribokinase family)